MVEGYGFTGAGAGFDDSGFFDQQDVDSKFVDELLAYTAYGDGYNAYEDVQQSAREEWAEVVEEGDGFFSEAFREQDGKFEETIATASPFYPLASPAPSPATSDDSAVSLSRSLDNAGVDLLNDKLCTTLEPLTTANYTPHPHILAHQPAPPRDPNALYEPLATSHFRTSAEAKAHRRRARIKPKSRAGDVVRVKTFGRDYWVCRIFNSMIYSQDITDGTTSIHRTRFTKRAVFDALDLEASAHHVFDEAIAVHERGWNRPKVYHKNTVRGKLVDISETSLELRLSRICFVLQQTKSAVDDAVRGGVTLALLCDNPEARRFTKVSNDAGNAKRGQRLKQTATKEKAVKAQLAQQKVKVEDQAQSGSREVSGAQDEEEELES